MPSLTPFPISPDRPADSAGGSAPPLRVLRVAVAGQTLALDMACVRELRGASAVRPLPGARGGVLGLLELRGEVLPVFDLGSLLGEAPAPADSPLVVLCMPSDTTADAGALACSALRVQSLDAVVDIPAAQWRPSPWPTATIRHLAITDAGPLPLVDLRHLLNTLPAVEPSTAH